MARQVTTRTSLSPLLPVLVVFACSMALGRTALAQLPSAAPAAPTKAGTAHEAALAEFRQARRYIEAGDCSQGVPHAEESLAYEPSIGARMSIAECVEKADPLRAWRSLADASLLAYANHDDRNMLIDKRLDELERALPLVHLGLSPTDIERPGLEVVVDGRLIDRHHAKRRIALEPGPHTIEVRAFGKAPWVRSIVAPAAGAVVELPVQLVDGTGAPPPPAVAPRIVTVVGTDPRGARRTAGLAIGAFGLAAIGTGAVFGILALGKRSELDDVCGGDRATCTARPELIAPVRDNASTLASVSTASFIVGGVGILAGAALYFWPAGAAQSAAGTAARSGRPHNHVRLTPSLGAVQGASIEGVF